MKYNSTVLESENRKKRDIQLLGFDIKGQVMFKTKQYELINRLARTHQQQYFVEGFKFIDEEKNIIVESTGMYTQSEVHFLNLDTMQISNINKLPDNLFGEGCDWIINKNTGEKEIHQMTYKERKVLVYDAELKKIKEFPMPNEMREGWGLKHFKDEKDSYYFYASDGTNQIFVIDPINWQVISINHVHDNQGQAINLLNEIEMINNFLYVNLYLSYSIAKINTSTFQVEDLIDLSDLVNEVKTTNYYRSNNLNYGHCLNGIAYNKKQDKLYVTGKRWPIIYQIKLNH